MSSIWIILWLLVFVVAVFFINRFLWQKINVWFKIEEEISRTALTAGKLSLLLTFNALFLGSYLYWEARSIFFNSGEEATIHLFLTREHGYAMFTAAIIIALSTPLVVFCSIMIGLFGLLIGWRAGDKNATRLAALGMFGNIFLVLLSCGLLGIGLFNGSSQEPTDTSDEVQSQSASP